MCPDYMNQGLNEEETFSVWQRRLDRGERRGMLGEPGAKKPNEASWETLKVMPGRGQWGSREKIAGGSREKTVSSYNLFCYTWATGM